MYTRDGISRDVHLPVSQLVYPWDTKQRLLSLNAEGLEEKFWRCTLRLRQAHFPELEALSYHHADEYLYLSSADVGRVLVVDFFDNGNVVDCLKNSL